MEDADISLTDVNRIKNLLNDAAGDQFFSVSHYPKSKSTTRGGYLTLHFNFTSGVVFTKTVDSVHRSVNKDKGHVEKDKFSLIVLDHVPYDIQTAYVPAVTCIKGDFSDGKPVFVATVLRVPHREYLDVPYRDPRSGNCRMPCCMNLTRKVPVSRYSSDRIDRAVRSYIEDVKKQIAIKNIDAEKHEAAVPIKIDSVLYAVAIEEPFERVLASSNLEDTLAPPPEHTRGDWVITSTVLVSIQVSALH